MPPRRVPKSAAAIAREKERLKNKNKNTTARARDAKRKRERYATDEDYREEKKEKSAASKPQQEWFAGVAHAIVTDDDGERTHHARFTREGFQHFAFMLFYCARECRFIRATRKKATRKKAKRDEAEVEILAPNDSDSEESETPTSTEADTPTSIETDDSFFDDDTDDEDALYDDAGNKLLTVEETLAETLEKNPFYYGSDGKNVDLDYWNVTCLERPLDLNTVIKLQCKVSCDDVEFVKAAVCERWGKSERFGDLTPAHLHVRPPSEEKLWGLQNYFIFANCYNNHKKPEDCDPTPLIGHGRIDIPKTYHKEFITSAVTIAGVGSWEEMKVWPWFKRSTVKNHVTQDQVEAIGRGYWEPVGKRPEGMGMNEWIKKLCNEAAQRRLDTLTKESEKEVDPVQTNNIYRIFKYHDRNPDDFRTLFMRHFTTSRKPLKQQIILTGEPSCGKSRLTEPIEELFCACQAPTNGGKVKWRAPSEFLQENRDCQMFAAKEFQKTVGYGKMDEDEFDAWLENTAGIVDPYAKTFAPRMPVLLNSQGMYFIGPKGQRIDFKSLKERLVEFRLDGATMEVMDLTIDPPAMAHFLLHPELDEQFTAAADITGMERADTTPVMFMSDNEE